MRAIAALKSRLQRTNPVEEQHKYNQMFSELVVLEARRKALHTRSIGGALSTRLRAQLEGVRTHLQPPVPQIWFRGGRTEVGAGGRLSSSDCPKPCLRVWA